MKILLTMTFLLSAVFFGKVGFASASDVALDGNGNAIHDGITLAKIAGDGYLTGSADRGIILKKGPAGVKVIQKKAPPGVKVIQKKHPRFVR